MIGVSSPLPPLCLACGLSEATSDDGACADCFADSQAKAVVQLAKERAEKFRFASLEWFTSADYVRLPFNSRSERIYQMRAAS